MSRGLLSYARLSALALCAVGLLQACGGGGGGGGGGSSDIGASSSGGSGSGSSSGGAIATGWAQQAYIKASNADIGDQFGNAIAIDGDTMVVGAVDEDSSQTVITNGDSASSDNAASIAGAAYVYVRSSDGNWHQQAYLKAPNASLAGGWFGHAVAISGDTIVVGASSESSSEVGITNGPTASSDRSASLSGAAYVFVRGSDGAWSQQAYLKASNADVEDFFGWSVAISGDTIVVGASGEDGNGVSSSDNSAVGSGAAYVFVRSGTTWGQQSYLKAPNTDAGDGFGWAVAVSGDTLVVAALEESSNQKTIINGPAASSDNSAAYSGEAYVYVRNGTTWNHQAYLKASNADVRDEFGQSVAISGDTVVVGVRGEGSGQTVITNGTTASSDNTAPGAGAAYVFTRNGTNWSQQAYLKAPNASAAYFFGESVAISDDIVVVGSPNESSWQEGVTNGDTAASDSWHPSAGAAYVFKRTGSSWSQQAYIKAADTAKGDAFGQSVAVSGSSVVVGVPNEASDQSEFIDAGAAYTYRYYP